MYNIKCILYWFKGILIIMAILPLYRQPDQDNFSILTHYNLRYTWKTERDYLRSEKKIWILYDRIVPKVVKVFSAGYYPSNV